MNSGRFLAGDRWKGTRDKSINFQVSMISYSSTGSELSEKARFHLFSRVVPPDNLQATVMAKVVREGREGRERMNGLYSGEEVGMELRPCNC